MMMNPPKEGFFVEVSKHVFLNDETKIYRIAYHCSSRRRF